VLIVLPSALYALFGLVYILRLFAKTRDLLENPEQVRSFETHKLATEFVKRGMSEKDVEELLSNELTRTLQKPM